MSPTAESAGQAEAGQAGRPHGLVGWAFGKLMARLNDEMNGFTLACLEVRPDQRVLEVGFGPGLLVEAIAERLATGSVDGIDWSSTMVAQASARNRAHIASGRVRLRVGSIAELPYPDGCFDCACAVNSFQFWPNPPASLRELRRVLRPGGRAAITLRAGPGRARFGMGGIAEPERIDRAAALLPEAGFGDVRVETKRLRLVSAACVLGTAA